MPVYNYKCKQCTKQFDLKLSMAEREVDGPKKICPDCKSKEIIQVINFKGNIGAGTGKKSCSSTSGFG